MFSSSYLLRFLQESRPALHSKTFLKTLISNSALANCIVSPNCNLFLDLTTLCSTITKYPAKKKIHFISCHARKLNINILIGMRVIKGVYQLSRLCRHLVTLHHFNAVTPAYHRPWNGNFCNLYF